MADRVESAPGRAGGGSVWYRLGYALERARASPPARLRSLSERLGRGNDADTAEPRPVRSRRDDDDDGAGAGRGAAVDALLAAGAGTLAARIVRLWPGRGAPGILGLARAGLAGASAALLRRLLTPLLEEGRRPRFDDETAEALAAGAARGLLYAAVVEPRLLGSPIVRGALYGSVEYAVSPWGGLTRVLGRLAPHRRVPFLDGLFEGYEPSDDTFVDHVAFAVALAVLYDAAGGGRDGAAEAE